MSLSEKHLSDMIGNLRDLKAPRMDYGASVEFNDLAEHAMDVAAIVSDWCKSIYATAAEEAIKQPNMTRFVPGIMDAMNDYLADALRAMRDDAEDEEAEIAAARRNRALLAAE